MKYGKPFSTYEEQADLLIARGMLVADRNYLIERLENIGYYRLSAYWFPFKQSDGENFKPNTDFETIYSHYRFDRRFKTLIFDAIERVETAVKARISYEFAQAYGAFGYLDQADFNNIPNDTFRQFLSSIDSAVRKAKQNKEHFVIHYFSKYDEETDLPIWMVSELITFGTMFTMLKYLHRPLQKNISSSFDQTYQVFEQWLLTLNYIRNVCAHNVRLWNRRLGIQPMVPTVKKHPQWNGVQNDRPFIILLILRNLLHICAPSSHWYLRMEQLFDEYPDLPIDRMGFPDHWREHVLWR